MRRELAEILRSAREHLVHEVSLGGRVLPPAAAPRRETGLENMGAGAPRPRAGEAREALSGEPQAAPERAPLPRSEGAIAGPLPPPSEAIVGPETPSSRPSLAVLREEAASCTRCRLHEGRTKSVFSRGGEGALVAFVGEGPGYHEDQRGLPFVGKAGQLLDKMIAAMGLTEEEYYICNVVKCRPPENRTPNPDEAAACMPFLEGQLAVVEPTLIVALGRCAAESLGCAEPGRRWRGAWGTFRGVRVMSTYHPAFLLRNPEQKRPVWDDLKKVVAALGRELPGRGR